MHSNFRGQKRKKEGIRLWMGVSNPPHPMEMRVVYRDKYARMGEGREGKGYEVFKVGVSQFDTPQIKKVTP